MLGIKTLSLSTPKSQYASSPARPDGVTHPPVSHPPGLLSALPRRPIHLLAAPTIVTNQLDECGNSRIVDAGHIEARTSIGEKLVLPHAQEAFSAVPKDSRGDSIVSESGPLKFPDSVRVRVSHPGLRAAMHGHEVKSKITGVHFTHLSLLGRDLTIEELERFIHFPEPRFYHLSGKDGGENCVGHTLRRTAAALGKEFVIPENMTPQDAIAFALTNLPEIFRCIDRSRGLGLVFGKIERKRGIDLKPEADGYICRSLIYLDQLQSMPLAEAAVERIVNVLVAEDPLGQRWWSTSDGVGPVTPGSRTPLV